MGRPKGSKNKIKTNKKNDGRGGARKGAGRKPKIEEQMLIEKLDNIITQDDALNKLKELINANDFRALQLYLNYRWGKPQDKMDITTNGNAFTMPIIEFFNTDDEDDEVE